MTTPDAQSESASPPQEEKEPSYILDPQRAAEEDLSLEFVLLGRRCSSCRERLEETGEMPTVKQHIAQIAKCCALKEGFIRPQMPIQEIVFRILLSERNQPASLSHLHSLLTEEWATPMNPKNVSAEDLKRILASDNYYGFKEIPQD